MRTFEPGEIAALAAEVAFGRSLVTNVVRALLVETIVSTALCPQWKWCSAGYQAFDFAYDDPSSGQRVRLEVKQSAVTQSWENREPSAIRWDIRPRHGFYDGDVWVPRFGRNADIYVLAAHLEQLRTVADHRDPTQWRFFVVNAAWLPEEGKSIGRSAIETMTSSVTIAGLADTVQRIRLALSNGLPIAATNPQSRRKVG